MGYQKNKPRFTFDELAKIDQKFDLPVKVKQDKVYSRGTDNIWEYRGRPIAVYNRVERLLRIYTHYQPTDAIKERLKDLLPDPLTVQRWRNSLFIVQGDYIENEKDFIRRLHNDIIPLRHGMAVNRDGFVWMGRQLVGTPRVKNTVRGRG